MRHRVESSEKTLRQNICLQMSSHVVSASHKYCVKVRRVPPRPGSRGGDDNQNFGGGLDGVSCLVIGKSIPVCAPPRKPSKDYPKAGRIPKKMRSCESQRRLGKNGDCTFSFVALIQQPVWLSSCSLGTTAPRGCGASGRRAHNTRSHTHIQTHTHTRYKQIVWKRHVPIKSRESQCRNMTMRRACGQQLIRKKYFLSLFLDLFPTPEHTNEVQMFHLFTSSLLTDPSMNHTLFNSSWLSFPWKQWPAANVDLQLCDSAMKLILQCYVTNKQQHLTYSYILFPQTILFVASDESLL